MARTLHEFLVDCAYPFAALWTPGLLARCHIRLGYRDGALAAAVWFSPVGDGVWDLHACAAPGARGSWLGPVLARPGVLHLSELKARAIAARPINHRHERLVELLGFVRHDGFLMLANR